MRLVENAFAMDVRMFRWCQQRRCRKILVEVARQLSRTADGHIYVAIGVLALYFNYYAFFLVAGLGFLSERIIYFAAKNSFKRNRPPDILPGFKSVVVASDKFSFPSGHTSAAFLMSTAIVIYFPSLAWVLYPWATSIGWSRVMLGVHFPGDTVAGAVLGSSVALAIYFYIGPLLSF